MGKIQISSAGLVYFHLCGRVLDDNKICISQTNSYSYFEKGFYSNVKENIWKTQNENEIVHLFGVVGESSKVDAIQQIIKHGIQNNVQRIIERKRISKKNSSLDQYGNTFFRLIQEYFCEELDHFPCGGAFHDSQYTVYYVYAGDENGDENVNMLANSMVELWIENEEPSLLGRQLMIRSFFMRDFIDRKVVACVPSIETGIWNVVLEGGIRIILDSEVPYSKEVMSYVDIGLFSISGLDDMLLETAYAFGKMYYPRELCKEWQRVFLYLCAIQEIEWNIDSFSRVYKKFLKYVEDNICFSEKTPTIISKEKGLNVLLIELKNIRMFLQGKEESVISKDLLQTLSSRYVYIPFLKSLFPRGDTSIKLFSRLELENRLKLAFGCNQKYEKGELWENVVAYVIEHIAGLKITGRRIRTGRQEIDISVANVSDNDELWKLGAYILVECKNWNKRVDIPVIRNVAYNSMMKGNKTVLLFSSNGITKDAQKEIERLAVNHIYILSIEKKDLLSLFTNDDCTDLILNKWHQLHSKIDNELPI